MIESTPPPSRITSRGSVLAGFALLVPALVLLVYAYVEPAVWTLRASLKDPRDVIPLGDRPAGGGVSFDNYGELGDVGFFPDLAAALAYATIPILAVIVAAPVLAWTAHRGGTVARWVTRGLLVLPFALYAPSALIAARILDYGLTEPGGGDKMRSHYWWGTFGLVVALATTLYLAALRRRDPRRQPWAALGLGAGIALVAVLAGALQEFDYSLVGAGAGNGPPLSRLYLQGTRQFDFGPAVAASSVVLLVVMLLGLAVTVAIVLSGLRLEFDPPRRPADEPTGWPSTRKVAVAIGAAVLLAVMIFIAYGLSPLLRHYFDGEEGFDDTTRILVDTWLPPLLTAFVGVLVATLAAVGIGWLRPLGRRSEWLLVPFGLFLFVDVGPFAMRYFAGYSGEDDHAITSSSLVRPWWVTVPALFVLTLLVRGQAQRRGEQPAARLLLPVLPMALLAFLVTWVVQAQDVGWAFVANPVAEGSLSAPVAVFRSAAFATVPVRLALPLGALVLFGLGALAAQLFYLDRIALRAGRPE